MIYLSINIDLPVRCSSIIITLRGGNLTYNLCTTCLGEDLFPVGWICTLQILCTTTCMYVMAGEATKDLSVDDIHDLLYRVLSVPATCVCCRSTCIVQAVLNSTHNNSGS